MLAHLNGINQKIVRQFFDLVGLYSFCNIYFTTISRKFQVFFFKIREKFLEFFYFSGFFDLRKTHNFGFKVFHIRRNVLLQRENNVFVPQKHRDAFRIGAFFYQPCSKGVP